MLYKGDFRSLDQSVDKKGQLYSVRIFTEYNPSNLNAMMLGESVSSVNVGPYPTKKINAYISGMSIVKKNVPDDAVNLTMCDHPFKVSYVGDDNPYKNHRCSTATVSFLQGELNTDFISTLGTNCLVMLLKWKNEVVDNGNSMYNTVTGETLNKVSYSHYDDAYGAVHTYWRGYMPWEYDAFCYEVEWVGFTLPGVLNCGYDHIFDRFTLQCQDAFSALQYKKFTKPSDNALVEVEYNTLLRSLLLLGTYKNVYLTTSVHYPLAHDAMVFQGVPTGNAMIHTGHQTQNFFDEYGNPMKWLDVIDRLMQYHSLTLIPWKDSIFVTCDDAIAGGMTEYNHFVLESTDTTKRLWRLPAETLSWSYPDTVNITDTFNVTKDNVCAAGTQISSSEVYDEVTVACDELHPEDLFPDMDDDENVDTDVPASQPLQYHLQRKGHTTENPSWMFWEAMFYGSNIDSVKCYKHADDQGTSNHWWWAKDSLKQEVQSSDLAIVTPISGRDYPGTALYNKNYCCIVDDNEFPSTVDDTEVPHNESFKRKFLFCNWWIGGAGSYGVPPQGRHSTTGSAHTYNFDDKTSTSYNDGELDYQQTYLAIRSKEVLFNSHQYINILGDWRFYRSNGNGYGMFNHYPSADMNNMSGILAYDKTNAFIYAYVKFIPSDPMKSVMYLDCQMDAEGAQWTSTKTMAKLPLDTNVTCPDVTIDGTTYQDCAGVEFPFSSHIRNLDGLYFKVPVADGYCEPGYIEILFDRQLGPTKQSNYSCASVCTLSDLELNVVSDVYVETKGKKEPEKDNTEYKNVLLQDAVEEAPTVDMIHSSTDLRGLSYAETCRYGVRARTGGEKVYKSNPAVINEVSGVYGIPEKIRVDAVRRNYSQPLVMLDFPLYRKGLSPVSRIRWNRLASKEMIVSSIDIDYEYEQCDVKAVQVRPQSDIQENTQQASLTRNYRRTRDIIFDGRMARRSPILLSEPARVTGNVVYVDNGEITIDTDNVIEGSTRIYADFAGGAVHAAVPGSGVSFSVNNGHVTLTTD